MCDTKDFFVNIDMWITYICVLYSFHLKILCCPKNIFLQQFAISHKWQETASQLEEEIERLEDEEEERRGEGDGDSDDEDTDDEFDEQTARCVLHSIMSIYVA